MTINTPFQCSQGDRPLHDFLLIPALFRSSGAHLPSPDQNPETKLAQRVGGKEDWRSLLQSVKWALGDAHSVSLWSDMSTLWFSQRNSAVFV